ncbi:uncharacterized protein TNCV_2552301 [Trichonephila clavipes]|nr:uncharacterized protein TNCV_2552301 [Trichonephila clavipes]
MVPGNHCMNGNTCGCGLSWSYHWAVVVLLTNTRGDRVLKAMAPHTITPEIESQFVAKKDLVLFRCSTVSRAFHHSKRRRRWVGVKGSTRNWRRDPQSPLAKRLRMVREDTRASSEGATCAWMAADETVVCTRAFLTMWRYSQRLVCRKSPEPCISVNV